ncbi:non-specific serine/threonine protein kinase [Salvia divinorum]|uniref:Non-specific serine/threonine protein kinase n=1 Tax=Salvia divinorum TaxID=28513 RepID=A0ABD1I1Z3_SALDI
MARIFGGKDDQANTTRVVGTYGYMSPESMTLSYSLCLEIVESRKDSQCDGSSHVDSGMEDDIVRYANVGLLCVQEIAADRPNMSKVRLMISCEILELPHPKQPAFLGM